MFRKILGRVAVGVATLWAVSALVFFGVAALPGDAATAALGQQATPEVVAALRKDFGLDRPVWTRYWEWVSGIVQGDLGRSLPSGDPVSSVVGDKARNTAALAAATIVLLVPMSIVIGVGSAVRRDRVLDHGVATTTLALISMPEFVIASLLAAVFAVWLKWLPAVSLVDPEKSILTQPEMLGLPVATLLAASVAQTSRMVRASMIDVLKADYVEMARLKGVPESRVLLRHALPNALAPTIQIIAINIAWLTGGVIIVESVFQFPGVGLTLSNAVAARDEPTVQAIALLIAAVCVCVNLLADIAVVLLNPRLRRAV